MGMKRSFKAVRKLTPRSAEEATKLNVRRNSLNTEATNFSDCTVEIKQEAIANTAAVEEKKSKSFINLLSSHRLIRDIGKQHVPPVDENKRVTKAYNMVAYFKS